MTLLRYLLVPATALLLLWLVYRPLPPRSSIISEVSKNAANAAIYMLARNSDVDGAVATIIQLEQRFNRNFHYPYVFLNDVPFDETFKSAILAATSSLVEFGVIPSEHWHQPGWIDEDQATRSRNQMEEAGIKYGGSISYRNMCRFNSGFFFKHPLMLKYRWYWRIEPGVKYHCNIDFDPFLFMQDHNKTYSFTIATYELGSTIPSLWSTVQDFGRKHPAYLAEGNALKFISTNYGLNYNLCHFWSNFEIADMNFWRGPAYEAFFGHLDKAGGFYYERWGDAPIHSIAAALFLNKNQIHFFDEIGYQHDDWSHCPSNPTPEMNCSCNPAQSFDRDPNSCKIRWDTLFW